MKKVEVGQVGLRRFRPHLLHNDKKTHVNCGFQKVVGQVGLARANHMEAILITFFFMSNFKV